MCRINPHQCVQPPPRSTSLFSDLFQCVVASRVCMHGLQPCPVKYRAFKEVSYIVWLLYCNYKVLLFGNSRASHKHLLCLSLWQTFLLSRPPHPPLPHNRAHDWFISDAGTSCPVLLVDDAAAARWSAGALALLGCKSWDLGGRSCQGDPLISGQRPSFEKDELVASIIPRCHVLGIIQ